MDKMILCLIQSKTPEFDIKKATFKTEIVRNVLLIDFLIFFINMDDNGSVQRQTKKKFLRSDEFINRLTE